MSTCIVPRNFCRLLARTIRTYHHGNLRRALLDAAVAFLADGNDFTMRELARAAKVTHAAPYRHFVDKEALLAAIAEEGFLLLNERGTQAREAAGDDARAWLRDLGTAYVLFAVDHPHHFRLMFGRPALGLPERYPALAEASQTSSQQLIDAIEACHAQGLLRKNLTTPRLVVVAWSLVHGLASLLVAGQLPGDAHALAMETANDLESIFFEGALDELPRTPPKRRARR